MSTIHSNCPVLIVGGGPTGLVAAIALAQNGIRTRIIDASIGPQPGQRGAALQARLFELFGLLGIAEPILEKAGRIFPRIQCYIPPHVKPMTPPKLASSPDIPHPVYLVLGQDRTEAILRNYLEESYGVAVEWGTKLENFTQNEEVVTASLVSTRGEESVGAQWLIGADGPRSTVRKLSGLSYVGETREDQRFIIGDVFVRDGLNLNFSYHLGDFAIKGIGLRPSESPEDGLVTFIIAGKDVPHDDLLADHRKILDFILSTTGWKDIIFGEIVYVEVWRPNIRMADAFSHGRAFIAGDSAHIHCTSGGQGIISCVQDAMNLSWKLALVEKGLSSPKLLATYSEERIPVIKEMLAITTATFDQIMSGETKNAPRLDLRQYGVNYRWSSIIVDDMPNTQEVGPYEALSCKPQAGDRAPEAPGLVTYGSETTSVFKLLSSSRHTVLVSSDTVKDAQDFVNAVKNTSFGTFIPVVVLPQSASPMAAHDTETLHVIDSLGHFRHFYVPDNVRRAFIIRPDGYLGAIVGSVDGITKYTSLIFSTQ